MAEKESWAAQCHTRRTAGGNERGWGRLEGQAYQCVCEDGREQAGFRSTTGWRSNPKRGYIMYCLSYTHAHIMSSNTAERLGVYGYFMNTPTLIPHQICSAVQRRRKRKVGHVCRFNEAKKRLYDKLMFSPPAELYSLQRTDSILF